MARASRYSTVSIECSSWIFQQTSRDFQGAPIWWSRRLSPHGSYEEGFWHLISREEARTGERRFDPRRAERLPWCGPVISNADDPAVLVWDFVEGHGRLRTYLWLEHLDYLVILESKQMRIGMVMFLVTAHHVDNKATRRSLRRKYAGRRV